MKSPTVSFDLGLNMARQALYRFAGLSLLDPRTGAWERLDQLRNDVLLFDAAALLRNAAMEQRAHVPIKQASIDSISPQLVLSQLPPSAETLNTEYEVTFGLLVSSNCPPYEMEYVNSKFTFQRSNTLADVSGFYRAFGVAGCDMHPERPDHIVLELEFMATLLGLERLAADSSSPISRDRQQICRMAQSRFMEEHLGWWAPAFCMLLGKQNGSGFYAAAGAFVAAFIAAEKALQGLPPTSPRVAPSTEERPECCDGCQLGV